MNLEKMHEYILPKGWTYAPINDLIGANGLFMDGDWIETKDQNPLGEVKLIQLADIGDGEYRNRSNRYMTIERAEKLNCTFLKAGDILVARMPDPLGRATIFPLLEENKYVTVVDVAIIRTGTGVYNKYLMYILNSPNVRSQIAELQTGTTRKRISRGNLSKIEIPVPPIEEQYLIVEKIEELFSELDNSFINLNQIKRQLKIYRHVLLKDAFEGKLSQKWRKGKEIESVEKIIKKIHSARADYNSKKKQEWEKQIEIWQRNGKIGAKPLKPKEEIKSVDLLPKNNKNLPDNWNLTTLGSVGHLSSGQHILEKDHFSFENGLPYLTGPSDFGKIYPTYSRWSPYPKVVAYPDDVLITVKGSGVGKINILNSEASIGRQLMAFTSFYQNKWFIYYYLQSQLRNLNDLSSGTAIPGIDRESILSFECPLVSADEQDAIVQEIHSQMSIIENLEKLSKSCQDKLFMFRKLILKNAYSGKLVPQNKDFQNAGDFLGQVKVDSIAYQKIQKEQRKLIPKINSMVKDRLGILEIMESAGRPISAKELWEQSIYSDNIELFYAELKKVESKIDELHKGFLSLKKDENR